MHRRGSAILGVLGLVALGACGDKFETCDDCAPASGGSESSGGSDAAGDTGGSSTGGTEDTGGTDGSGGAEETGGAENTGGMGGIPFSCDECTSATEPVCDEAEEECVQCLPVLDESECVGTNTPVCGPENTCVQCTEDRDNACTTDRPYCSPDNECVQCLTAEEHCSSLDAPVCDAGSCVRCDTQEDCARFEDTPVCDRETGMCVGCTAETEQERCGEYSCSSVTQTCTETKRGMSGTCAPCEADSECSPDRKCVMDTFDGGEVGYFCFLEEGTVGCGDVDELRRPYASPAERTSIDGNKQNYCMPPAATTCQGIIDTRNVTCTTDAECGMPDLDDGYCPSTGDGKGACSYRCTGGFECVSGLECSDSPQHCNPIPN